MQRTVAIVGTLDTKGAEYKFVKDRIDNHGVNSIIIDVGTGGEPLFPPDITAREVAEAVGVDFAELKRRADRGYSVEVMGKGAAVILKRLQQEGKIHGVISVGGSGGTSIGTTAMRALPTGFPKMMVSTVASGDTKQYVGAKDIIMMNSVVDVAGLNIILKSILSNAAAAISAMAKEETLVGDSDKPIVAATMFGVTTPCVSRACEILERAGYEVLVFHAVGTGGMAMEDLIADGFIKGVLDITTTELADELVGGLLTAGPERLEAAGEEGIPQVVAPGALDMVNFWGPETVPERFKGRLFYQHNPQVTLMRTTKEENRELGRIIAQKLNRAKGQTVFLWPRRGISLMDKEGQPFYDPEADKALINSLKENLEGKVELIEMDLDINDDRFAAEAANQLIKYLDNKP
jgi:uncharacterized protein (UPF0261 family)